MQLLLYGKISDTGGSRYSGRILQKRRGNPGVPTKPKIQTDDYGNNIAIPY